MKSAPGVKVSQVQSEVSTGTGAANPGPRLNITMVFLDMGFPW